MFEVTCKFLALLARTLLALRALLVYSLKPATLSCDHDEVESDRNEVGDGVLEQAAADGSCEANPGCHQEQVPGRERRGARPSKLT